MDQAADWLYVPQSSFKHFSGLPVFFITAEAFHCIEPSDQFVSTTYFHNMCFNTKSKGALHIFFICAGVPHVDLFMHHIHFTGSL